MVMAHSIFKGYPGVSDAQPITIQQRSGTHELNGVVLQPSNKGGARGHVAQCSQCSLHEIRKKV